MPGLAKSVTPLLTMAWRDSAVVGRETGEEKQMGRETERGGGEGDKRRGTRRGGERERER